MKSVRLHARLKWLFLLLAVLLPLHTGFAQATMHAPAQAAAVTVATAMHPGASDDGLLADGVPCHHAATPPPSTDHPPAHGDGCCDTGSCHCVAACGLPFQATRVRPQRGGIAPLFANLSVPAAIRPPDLRPPIH